MADERVSAAIANWAPRFVSQGVDYNDFVRTTSGLDRWEDWLPAWSATGDMHTQLAEQAEAAGNQRTAGEAYVRAGLCYHFAKFVWMLDPDQHQAAADKSVASTYAAHRNLDPSARRVEIPFEAKTLVGNLRTPSGRDGPPLVMLVPGLDSTKDEFFNWENVFLKRGLATFSLDGPGQGESGVGTHIRADYELAVTAALDALSLLGGVATDGVGLVGVSMGGYYAPRAAAFEPRVAAVATIGGPYDFGECWPQLPSITRGTFLHHSGAGNDAEAHQRAAELSLAGVAPRIAQPLLVVFGKLDRLIPWEHAERLAAEAPNARLEMFPDGNHVCNNIPYKYRPLVADWMVDQLRR